jgi:GxxExxY protein
MSEWAEEHGPREDLSDTEVNQICDVVRECGFALHRFLGPGFRERVYQRGLTHRLRKAGSLVETQVRTMIYDDDGTLLAEEAMDLVVEKVLIVELRAVRQSSDADVAQLLGYLKATRYRHGVLINFGAPKFYIKKYVM